MKHSVITLVAGEHFHLDPFLIHHISQEFKQKGAIVGESAPLSEGKAWDIYFEGLSREVAEMAANATLQDKPVDYVVQEVASRRKKLLISDMDSTIINQECIDELADFAGCRAHIAAITERAMNGELDFKAALRERVALLAGLPESVLEETYAKRITLMSGAKALVATMRAAGATAILVSGGFTFFTRKVAEAAGFNLNEANILEIQHGKLTGKVIEPILDKEAKLASLQRHREALHLAAAETLAAGDGANDLPMLLEAGLGVAYHAKPAVRAQANAQVNHADLRALLYIQGYREEEIHA